MRNGAELGEPGGDCGFTLVELLLAIVIIGVITVPLSGVLIGFLKNTDATTARLIESHDGQIASAYWAQDVASIGTRLPTYPYAPKQSVERNVSYNLGLYPCGAAGTPSAIVRLAWDDFSLDPSTNVVTATVVRVAYVVKTVSGATELHRLRCQGSAAVVSDVTLAHVLDPSTLPALTCATPTTCTTAVVPVTLTLTLTIKDPKNQGGAYVVPLTGQRRQSQS
jgi:prepilin-type N-terminal cleavage/methylation domain-containing protein